MKSNEKSEADRYPDIQEVREEPAGTDIGLQLKEHPEAVQFAAGEGLAEERGERGEDQLCMEGGGS